ncbi:MAG: hypothetical protein AAF567_21070 [Actinomycetota bacterium]
MPIAALAGFGGWWAWDHMEDGLDDRAAIHLECEGIDTSGLDFDWSYRDVAVTGELPEGVTPARVEAVIDHGSDDAGCLRNAGLDPDDNPGVYDVELAGLTVAPSTSTNDEAASTAVTADDPEADGAVGDPSGDGTDGDGADGDASGDAEAAQAPDPTATPLPEPTPVPDPTPAPTATPEPEPTAAPTATPVREPSAPILVAGAYDGRQLTLAGVVDSEEQRQALVSAAADAVGEANVVDRLQIDPGRAEGPDGSNGELVGDLADVFTRFGGDLVSGNVALTDGSITWDLVARSAEVAEGLSLPGTGSLDAIVQPAPSFTG